MSSRYFFVSSAAIELRSATTTLAPSLASTWQTALPMPLPPPMKIVTLLKLLLQFYITFYCNKAFKLAAEHRS